MAAVATIGASSALASAPRARVGTVTPRPAASRVVGATPAARRLQVTIELQPKDPLGLKTFATAVSTPGNPDYGHYLTVRQFADRFAARPADAAKVARTLRRYGLHVGALTRNDMELPVSGTVANLQRAFAVREQQVRMPHGRIAYANAQDPTLPVTVAPYVQGVIGLDDVTLDQPAGFVRATRQAHARHLAAPHVVNGNYATNGGPQLSSSCDGGTPASFQQPQNSGGIGESADELATAYGFSSLYGQGDLGAGQTIALFEEEDFNLSAVQSYGACYGITINPQVINVAGGPPQSVGGGEAELDIEVVAGMAPQAAIQVYQGPGNQSTAIYNTIVAANQAKVISSSWGACETATGAATINAENTILQEAAAQGQSFFISSGDSGSSMCLQHDGVTTSLSVIDPGGQPFATGVGGTNVYTPPNNYYEPGQALAQGVWNDGGGNGSASGSGGGLSQFWTMPSYQSSAPATLGVINSESVQPSLSPTCGATYCREVPDVSADADPDTGYIVNTTPETNNGNNPPAWGIVGGTSAAAPLWASFTALANASATCRHLPLGFVNPSLYSVAGSAYNSNFDDITSASTTSLLSVSASNDALGVNGGLYQLFTGYDMATGLGSMANAGTLAQSMCALRAPVYTVAVASPGTVSGTVGTPVALQIHATDSGNAALSYSASGLPAGLAINPSTGAITGTPTTVGTSTVTVAAGDGYANSGSTQFAFTVAAPVLVKKATAGPSHVSLAGLSRRRPQLTFTLKGNGASLKGLGLEMPAGFGFARSRRTLARHITVKVGSRRVAFRVASKRRVLAIAPRHPASSITVTVGYPALTITRSEAAKVRRHKVRSLTIAMIGVTTKRKVSRYRIRLAHLR